MQNEATGDLHSRSSRLENYGYYASKGAIMNIYQNQLAAVFEVLRPDFVQDALYNSATRQTEHAVTCQVETRTKILRDIRYWADMTKVPVCWLSGPAGTGKSTVAHTIAEEYDRNGKLAATFFFWRKTGDRDDINRLVATLLCQIAKKVPSVKEELEEILKEDSRMPSPSLRVPLSKLCLQDQFSKLLVKSINRGDPNLIIIDGLDECASRQGICRLIEWIFKNNSPFRFFLISRPEPEIKGRFTSAQGSDIRSFYLSESEEDIRKYLVEQLEKAWPKQQRLTDSGPSEWPEEPYLNQLVEKSEGLFVYAAAVVRYISGEGYSARRLQNVLKLHNGLDGLYAQVIEEAKKWDFFDPVMRSLMYLRYPLTIDDLSSILLPVDEHLSTPGIRSALGGCHSILVIPTANAQIVPYHASLRDFLIDKSRSATLFLAPSTCHGLLMFECLSVMSKAFSDGTRPPEYALVSWYYHASSFLSSGNDSAELGELDTKTRELVKKVDLNFVRSWMMEALYYAGVYYMRVELPPTKDLPATYWTRNLEPKLRSIYVVLETFLGYHKSTEEWWDVRLHHVAAFVRHKDDLRNVVEKFFHSERFKLLPQINVLEGSMTSALSRIYHL